MQLLPPSPRKPHPQIELQHEFPHEPQWLLELSCVSQFWDVSPLQSPQSGLAPGARPAGAREVIGAVAVLAALLAGAHAGDLTHRAVAHAGVVLVEGRVARDVALAFAGADRGAVHRGGTRAAATLRAARVGIVGVVLLTRGPAQVEPASNSSDSSDPCDPSGIGPSRRRAVRRNHRPSRLRRCRPRCCHRRAARRATSDGARSTGRKSKDHDPSPQSTTLRPRQISG